METLTKIDQLRDITSRGKSRATGPTIAFVPTMGYLHDGHLSLVKLARERADTVVMSIYVNPTQFNSAQDLQTYPRNIERDSVLAKESGVDLLYLPDDSEIYSPQYDVSHAVRVHAGYLANGFCGAHRPGHFDGVVLVVAKLFNIVRPDIAIFGEKDFQQLQVIRQMVKDLCFPVEIVGGPLVRESDGLALSSRNVRLSLEARQEALKIYKALLLAKSLYDSGEIVCSKILTPVREVLESISGGSLEYADIVDSESLKPIEQIDRPARLLAAVWVGNVRLIDNIAFC